MTEATLSIVLTSGTAYWRTSWASDWHAAANQSRAELLGSLQTFVICSNPSRGVLLSRGLIPGNKLHADTAESRSGHGCSFLQIKLEEDKLSARTHTSSDIIVMINHDDHNHNDENQRLHHHHRHPNHNHINNNNNRHQSPCPHQHHECTPGMEKLFVLKRVHSLP